MRTGAKHIKQLKRSFFLEISVEHTRCNDTSHVKVQLMYQRNGFALKKHAQSRESVLFYDIMSEKEVLIDASMGTNTGM